MWVCCIIMSPFIITLGGNVGCGKSTVIESLKNEFEGDQCVVSSEPIGEWGSWLDLFYTDPVKYAFGFQMKILHSFMKLYTSHKTMITERSPLDSLEVFAKTLYNDKLLNHLEYNLYKSYIADIAWTPSIYIYIRTEPDTCIKRINKRARGCETGLDEKYIHRLHSAYEDIQTTISDESFFVVDGNQTKDIIYQSISDIIKKYVVC